MMIALYVTLNLNDQRLGPEGSIKLARILSKRLTEPNLLVGYDSDTLATIKEIHTTIEEVVDVFKAREDEPNDDNFRF